jgi:3-hydroxyacyl-[acyl-carrier-protein] dehydratase
MRWFWIDRYTEFESGRQAKAVKNVSLAEEHLHDHFPGAPVMPNSLILEGLAQTGGLLVGEHGGFEQRVVLAKVASARFHRAAVPGDTLVYHTTVDDINPGGAVVSGTSRIGGELQAEVQLFFAHLDQAISGNKWLFDPAGFLAMLRLLGVFDIGRDAEGRQLQVPAGLLLASQTGN